MISVQEAEKLIRRHAVSFGTEDLSLAQSHGSILQEELIADRDYPPFHRVAMDGYAIPFAAWEKGQRRYFVEAMQTAGQAPKVLQRPDAAIEIMTGAKLAEGCAAVVRYEDTTRDGDFMTIADGVNLQPWTNVHPQGADAREGTRFPAQKMTPPLAAIAASFGVSYMKTQRKARIAMIGTGDELVAIDAKPLDYQIRESNIHAVRMALTSRGYRVEAQTIRDDRHLLFQTLEKALAENDLLLLSGGVSAGKTDFVPEILQELGVRKIFHKIAQKPGKPLWFGQRADGKTVFALPGNPVSSLICLYRYALPFLESLDFAGPYVELQTPRPKATKLTHFVPVKIRYSQDARILAFAAEHNGSGDFISLHGTDGFVEIPGEMEDGFDPAQTIFKFYGWT